MHNNENNKGWETVQNDDALRKYAIESLVEGFLDLQTEIRSLKNTIKTEEIAVIESFQQRIEENVAYLQNGVENIPDSLDEKIQKLIEAARNLERELNEKSGELRGVLSTAQENASERLYGSIREASEQAREVISAARSAVKDINSEAETAINSALKNALENCAKSTAMFEKNMDGAIRRGFEKATRRFTWIWGSVVFLSSCLQFGMWGWFVWMLTK